ncbi:MAG: hypothetical protein AAF638_05740 [Pseudomonadota bacterium]
MTLLRAIILLSAAVFAALIIWAMGQAPLMESFSKVIADPWGLVAIVDLYLGFLLILIVVWFAEPSKPVAAAVIVATPFLGNVIPAVWLAYRLTHIATAFHRSAK